MATLYRKLALPSSEDEAEVVQRQAVEYETGFPQKVSFFWALKWPVGWRAVLFPAQAMVHTCVQLCAETRLLSAGWFAKVQTVSVLWWKTL